MNQGRSSLEVTIVQESEECHRRWARVRVRAGQGPNVQTGWRGKADQQGAACEANSMGLAYILLCRGAAERERACSGSMTQRAVRDLGPRWPFNLGKEFRDGIVIFLLFFLFARPMICEVKVLLILRLVLF